MDILWNVGIGFVVAAAIPWLVPIREGAGPTVVGLGVTGALLAVFLGRASGLVADPSGASGMALSAFGTLAVLVVVGLAAKRVA
jgi:hypothetical protein